MHQERIAIIGVGCRFPGGVNDTEALWKLLIEGREAVGEVPADRWNVERFYDAESGIEGKSIARRGGFIDGLDEFDPQFFGISPREAPYVDPQHRLLLETAWEAIDDAGIVLDFERGTDIAVYVGISHNDYQCIQGSPWEHSGISPHSPTGSAHSIAANRISYCLNLKGPSVAMDTACSSALTAVHAACEHIWSGRGDTAMAGGVTIMITPGGFIGFSQASMLSPEGRCKAFAASADGFVRGEGAGMVVLKRLSQALADGDPIRGVIVSTALNQDGHTNGISLPSPEAQARLVQDACTYGGVRPEEIGFVEAHGTGTAVGDPIEAHALAEALCQNRTPEQALPIGSVKTNLGHLETAAGMAGLLKAMLVVKHGQIPGSLHFDEPSPHIDFDGLKLRVPTALEPFPKVGSERLAGVNSFGFGGANAHVIVAEPPPTAANQRPAAHAERSWPLVLSARSEESLRVYAERLAGWLEIKSKANGSSPILPELTYTLGVRRNHHPYRMTLVVRSMEEAIQELRDFAAGQPGPKIRTSYTPRPATPPRVAFVMSGQGPQWWGMGRELMKSEPVFRAVIERCDEAMRPFASFSLLEEFAKDEASSQLHRTEYGQPAIFAYQVALAELWKSWGVEPSAVVGHSVGEVAAACVAGILGFEEACRVIVLRAALMERCARGAGTMLAVGLTEEAAAELLARNDRTIKIAAYNGPKSLTLAGPRPALEKIAAELEAEGVFARLVKVDHPFHHPLMEPAAQGLETALRDLAPKAAKVSFFSTVTGTALEGEKCDAKHWGNGIRHAVRFAPAVSALAETEVDVWLELSAHPALVHSTLECLGQIEGSKPVVISSLRREREQESILETAMDLHRHGVTLAFANITPSRRFLSLPSYAWEKQRWWHESNDWREGRLAPGGRGLLDLRLPRANPTWTCRLDARHMAFLQDHIVDGHVIFPAAGFVDMVLEAGRQLFDGRPFAVEDFEIRKPLILPESPIGVQIELSYEPVERTFAIQSRFEHAASWSLHVVGSLRAERTESVFATSEWAEGKLDSLESVNVGEFYQYMADVGLRYGEEFRGVRKLETASGKAEGTVALTDAAAKRVANYALHPVILDGALHVFSAGASTIEERGARMKLPVRFGRILFLQPPGAMAQVRSEVRQCTSELVEGSLGLYNAEGQPCVLVDGFRAIAVSRGRRGGSRRDVIYHLDWQRTPISAVGANLSAPVSMEALCAASSEALEQVLETRGRAELQVAMAAADDLAAAQIAAGLQRMGVRTNAAFDAETLGIAKSMRPAFERLMRGLVQRSLVKREKEGFRASAKLTSFAESADEVLRKFIADHPGHLAEALLCAATSAELDSILTGKKDAVQVLFTGFGSELLDHFYGDGRLTSHWLAAIAAAVHHQARQLPEGRGLRILEVGAGTGGLSAQVLPTLERGLHTYTFSDVSAGFFPAAQQKLASFPEVEFKILDLESPGVEQGFEAGSYDFVIGTNVLHAVSDLRATLRHLQNLLAPGGVLAFMDVATPQLWTDSVFGLTSGWWSFTDTDLRTEHPLLPREDWMALLAEVGFEGVSSLPGLEGPEGEGQFVILARKPPVEAGQAVHAETAAIASDSDQSWLVFADQSGFSEALVSRVRTTGARCRVVQAGAAFDMDGVDTFTVDPDAEADMVKLLSDTAEEMAPTRIVYAWALDATMGGDDATMGTGPLLALSHALDTARSGAKLRLDLITRGAQAVGVNPAEVAVAQAPAVGLLRVILNEYPNLTCRGIDLPPQSESADLDRVWAELMRPDGEREVAFRGEARYVQRLDTGRATPETWLAPGTPMRLVSRERGQLDSLRFSPFELPVCADDEVLVEVKAAGMNFRDVLKALGLYPGDAPDARIFGDEIAGIVRATGAGVTHVKVGDAVFGLAVYGLATHTLARAGDVRRIPAGCSFDEAATLPVVYMTAWHALDRVARLRAGESILIHAGAGGVGMAAVQLARHLGLKVIATAGSSAKRALLENMGVEHVLDSRKGDFSEAVLALTGGRGVDAVLNALAGEAIPMGLACLAEFGRFIEIGKRDIYQNSRIPLWNLRRNASFHVVAMDAVFHGDGELTRHLLETIANLVEQDAITPLPFRSFPATQVDAAFRLMASGKHIGKVLVGFAEPFVPRRGESLAPTFAVRADATYLITGAFGGFGKVVARWLVERGASSLVLCSRSGASTAEARGFVHELEADGVAVRAVKADIGEPEDVTRLFKECTAAGKALRGVFHLAMVIDDAPLVALTPERMAKVIEPKARGAWLLHEHTLGLPLDCFVMFSSVSSIFGNPAQGNYGAANAFLDALAHHRRALGLPALTMNWGVLGGEGYVARNERVAEFLARQGTAELSPGEVIKILEGALQAGDCQLAAIRVDWAKWKQFFRGMQENPMLERIFASIEGDETASGGSNWRAAIEAAAPEERRDIISLAVRDVVGGVLRVKPESLREDQPLTDLGLDSLMGVEIENSLEAAVGIALPPTSLMRARTIGQIATLIAEQMGAPVAAAPVKKSGEVADPVIGDDIDLDLLADDGIDELLGSNEPAKAGARE